MTITEKFQPLLAEIEAAIIAIHPSDALDNLPKTALALLSDIQDYEPKQTPAPVAKGTLKGAGHKIGHVPA